MSDSKLQLALDALALATCAVGIIYYWRKLMQSPQDK